LLAAADRRFLVLPVDLDKILVLVLGFDPAGHLRAVEVVLCVGIGKVVGRVAWGDVAFCCCCFFGFFGFLEGGKELICKILLILVFSRHFQGNVSVESGWLTGPVILKTFCMVFTVLSCRVAGGNQDIRLCSEQHHWK
jgi:hypothetical protein